MIAWRTAAAWLALAACSSEHRTPPAPAPVAAPRPAMVARPEKPARPRFTGVITAEESASLAPRAPGVIKAVAGGISPAQNVEEQRMNVKRAEAAVERARSTHAAELARAQTARDHFADTELRAPFSGTVALRFHDAGNRVQAGEPIIKLVGQGRMRLRFAIAPEDARTIAPDATVTATVDTIASPLTATVKQVAPAVDPATGMIIVDAELAADDHAAELRPGLAAWVTLP